MLLAVGEGGRWAVQACPLHGCSCVWKSSLEPFPSDLLRPSPNYRGTSGFPVSLIFQTLFLKKKKKEKQKTNKKAHTFLHIMPQWKENRPSIFRPQFALFFFNYTTT